MKKKSKMIAVSFVAVLALLPAVPTFAETMAADGQLGNQNVQEKVVSATEINDQKQASNEIAFPNIKENQQGEHVNTMITSVAASNLPEGKTYAEIFPDPIVADKISTAVGKTTSDLVTQTELDTIDSLTARGTMQPAKITNLEGMQYLRHLNYLALTNNKITDLSPLSNLTNLTYLDVGMNEIVDISPIGGLAAHHPEMTLLIDSNHIMDISSLSGFNSISKANSQALTATDFISTSNNEVKMHYPVVGADGQTIEPRFVQPAGGRLEADEDGENYIVWDRDSFMAAESGEDIFVYIEFYSEPENSMGFGGQYRVYANQFVPPLTVDPEITYPVGTVVSEEQFLEDVHVQTDTNCTLKTTLTAVNWTKPGDYTVYIQATAPNTNIKSRTSVLVHIAAKAPSLTCDNEVTYTEGQSRTSAQFLQDIHAATEPGNLLTSNFDAVVNFSTPGDYRVTIKASSPDTNKVTEKAAIVHIKAADKPSNDNTPSPDHQANDDAADMKVKEATTKQVNVTLPETGDQCTSVWSIVGVLIALIGFYGLRKK